MRAPLTTYLSALVSSGAVFRFFGAESWPWVALLAAISALLGLGFLLLASKAWRATTPIRASWHLSRAATLSAGSAATSGARYVTAALWVGCVTVSVWRGVHAVAVGAL